MNWIFRVAESHLILTGARIQLPHCIHLMQAHSSERPQMASSGTYPLPL